MRRLAAFFVLFWIGTQAHAQKLDVGAIVAEAQGAADELGVLREKLADPDINVRLAIFDAMVAHGDPTLYEVATSMAIKDVDPVLRSRVMWEVLSRKATITILIDPEGTVTDKDLRAKMDSRLTAQYVVQIGSVVPVGNCLVIHYVSEECNPSYNFIQSGETLTMHFSNQKLRAQFRLNDKQELVGEILSDLVGKPVPAKIVFR